MTSCTSPKRRVAGIVALGLLLSGAVVTVMVQRGTRAPERHAAAGSVEGAVPKSEGNGHGTPERVNSRPAQAAETRERLDALSEYQRAFLAPSFEALDWMERHASETRNDALAVLVEQERARGVRAAEGLPRHGTSKER